MTIPFYGRARRIRSRKVVPTERRAATPSPLGVLRLLTLNIAHARSEAQHQALVAPGGIVTNLERIATVLRREAPDVVALQEADGPSAWSGRVDHVATLALLAGYPHTFRGEHNPEPLGRFELTWGTALLSRVPLAETRSRAFQESWRDTKGFVVARIAAACDGDSIDVVSVHLDFLSARIRRRQVDQLVAAFRDRLRPLVLMGDLNCEWHERPRSLALLARELKLHAPFSAHGPTFPTRRPLASLDWILVSDELAFAEYATLDDRISDHLGVVATVRARGAADQEIEPLAIPV